MKQLKALNGGVTDDEKSQETFNSSSADKASPPLKNRIITTSWKFDGRTIQNFRLVWLDNSIDDVKNDDSINIIAKLREVVNTVKKFTDINECIDFVAHIQDETILMICSEELGQTAIPRVHEMIQINCIYIFCKHEAQHEQWANKWPKVKGVYTDITSICKALKLAAQDCDHNSVSISFVKTIDGVSNQKLDTLDQSFMYMQILKEILLTINFEQEHIDEFLTYCREQFIGNNAELNNVEKIHKEYHHHQPIWWYTYDCFLRSMLNRALRMMEVDLIVKLEFFIRDLHNHISALHAKQFSAHQNLTSFTVYRGQALSQTDFDQLKTTQGGLLSFNNFLSTTQYFDVSLEIARRTTATSNLIGVLFVLKIDPSISATPFANVKNASYYQEKEEEEEILFSIPSIFRIGQVKQIDKNDRLWQVDLTLTGDNDPQLHDLAEIMQKEIASGSEGWFRLGQLMIKLGQFNKAEELYEILLEQTTLQGEKAHLFHQLGMVKDQQGEYGEATKFYKKSIKINQKIFPPNHADLAASRSCLGLAYYHMGKYSKALPSLEKAHEIYQETLPPNHPLFITSYNSLGNVYDKMKEYSKALPYYEKVLEIRQKTLPENHPDLATSHNNISLVYDNMGEPSKALPYYEKVLDIYQKTLPANHPLLATSYNNIGLVYDNIGEHSKALSYYEKSLEIRQKTLPANHPDFATSYNNIGWVYRNMGEYSKALLYYEYACDILQHSLPPNHPHLEDAKKSIEIVKKEL